MSKLYIFGIGGTGSRVLRAFTMMLASGVKIGADEIVPIIIDPDVSNADLSKTITLFRDYSAVHKELHYRGDGGAFLKAGIEESTQNYTMRISDTGDRTFRQFIGLDSMSKPNQALARMLFSDKNLASSMNVGFKGNPNMGSVVLNQFKTSKDFERFANGFSQGDRIFIISSIFGGTGASGFPLLFKTLRTDKDIPNFATINEAVIGALTILPYFRLEQDNESEIDSSTFISKTKSALAYYEKNIIDQSDINKLHALYYLADDVMNTYDNHEGGSEQENDAHLIEFLGATAIVDFSNKKFDDERTTSSNMELGVKDLNGGEPLTFASFYPKMREMLFYPLTQFALMSNALMQKLDFYKSKSFDANKNFSDIYPKKFFADLLTLCRKYREWLNELQGNKRSLDLFNLNCGDKPFDLVKGINPKTRISIYSDYDLVTARLNAAAKKCKSNNDEAKYLEMFYLATQKLVSEKLSN